MNYKQGNTYQYSCRDQIHLQINNTQIYHTKSNCGDQYYILHTNPNTQFLQFLYTIQIHDFFNFEWQKKNSLHWAWLLIVMAHFNFDMPHHRTRQFRRFMSNNTSTVVVHIVSACPECMVLWYRMTFFEDFRVGGVLSHSSLKLMNKNTKNENIYNGKKFFKINVKWIILNQW